MNYNDFINDLMACGLTYKEAKEAWQKYCDENNISWD